MTESELAGEDMEVKKEQLDFSDWEHSPVKKQTGKEKFLWQVEAGYPSQTAGEGAGAFLSPSGTPRRKATLATGTMVRIHWMQNWCSLSDAIMEDALIDAPSAALPELILRSHSRATTILAFRHGVERYQSCPHLHEEREEGKATRDAPNP